MTMKRNLLVIFALLLSVTMLQAKPVDANRAMRLGQAFLEQKQAKNASTLVLSYVQYGNSGQPTAYVFNADEGFVIVSADDSYHPILGYADQGRFDYETAPDGMLFMLGEICNEVDRCISEGIAATADVVTEWKNIEASGCMHAEKNLPVIDMLVQQRWDQMAPYNMYVPNDCPTGCVATAMAQLMKYWEWPVTGTGSHSYQWMGQTLSADFGATTYQWDLMLDSYSNGTITPENKAAVATLMYHCGISVNMMYEPDGSGAYSPDVPIAIHEYFSYSDQATHIAKAGYSYDEWIDLLKTNIDQHIPIYYSGQSPDGGHAFICDGYDTDGLFHFNWGWGGSSNNYFLIDGNKFEYSGSQAIVYDFIPNYVYDQMPQAVTGLSVSIDSDISRIGHLVWTNPTTTMTGEPLTTIDKVIIKRNDMPVQEITGTAPGQTVTIDDEVPFFDQFDYTVHVLVGDNYGRTAKTKAVFGPYCDWKVIMTSASFQGWDGGGITVQNAAGSYIDFLTTTQATATIQTFQMALGNNNLYWVAPNSTISNLSFKIKDSQNQLIYEYEGSSTGLEAGLLRTLNNSCGNENTCEAPYNLVAAVDPDNVENVILTWESNHEPEFGYCIYRDGILFNMAHETRYIDEHTNIGGHCYYVTSLCTGGETAKSNDFCVTSGTGCNEPKDMYYEFTTNKKIQLNWSAPEGTWPTGYIVYRKTDDMASYKEIKRLKQTTLKDTSVQQGTTYQYAVVAYYDTIDCTSTYANDILNPQQYYVRVDWSNAPRDLRAELVEGEMMHVNLRWHPAFLAMGYSIMRNGVVIGEVTDATFTDEQLEVEETYCYTVIARGEGFEESSNEACVTTPATPEPPVLPCTAPTDFVGQILAPDSETRIIRLEWQAPADRTPESYTLMVGETEEQGITDTFYELEIPVDIVVDYTFMLYAVYPECQSEPALTAEGDNFIHLTNLAVDEQSLLNVKLYPNPTTGQLSIEADGTTFVNVYNLVGQCVMQMPNENGKLTLDMSQLPNGMYLVKVSSAEGAVMQRVVKM